MKKIIIMACIAASMAACKSNDGTDQVAAQQRTIDSLKNEAYKKQIADSVAQAVQLQQQQVSYESTPPASTAKTSTTRHYRSHSSSGSSGGNGTASTQTTTTTTQTQQKKGWSAKAKGAVIGAGAGAITGAMVDKRKGEGAIIGGILGAGAGLGTGAIIDAEQKKKQQQQQQK